MRNTASIRFIGGRRWMRKHTGAVYAVWAYSVGKAIRNVALFL